MKTKLLALIFIAFSGYSLVAQNEVDALRYSQLLPVGTARFSAMGGAFGALGGDITTMAFNPAGLGIYRTSELTFTPSWSGTTINSTYYNTSNTSSAYNFHVGNTGFVIASPSVDNSDWKFVNLGFAYNQLMNFNAKKYISGANPISSYLDGQTQDVNDNGTDGNLFASADLIYLDDVSGKYVNDYTNNGYNETQSKSVQSSGYAGEYDFSVGANYNDLLYFGATMGIVHINYVEKSLYSEVPLNNPDLVNFDSYDYFNTTGNGFNLKMGLIARVNDFLRIGGAFHTPTLYSLHDTYWSEVNAKINYVDDNNVVTPTINNAKSGDGKFDWNLTSPLKAIGSAAFIIGDKGLVSVDYEYLNYMGMNMEASDYQFTTENQAIQTIYRGSSNVKIGGEYRVGPLSFRGGMGYYGSPYGSSEANKSANYMVYSGGLGIRASDLYFDFAYQHAQVNEKYFLYGTTDSESSLKIGKNSFIATLGIKF